MDWAKARRWAGIVLLNLVLCSLLSAAVYSTWVHGAYHTDFFPRWAGARLLLFERRDLYSQATTRQMQIMLYGAPLSQGLDQQGFVYPAQLVPLLLPFWFLDKQVSAALWQGVSILLMIWTLLLVRRVHPMPMWAALGLLLWYYPLLMLYQAQFMAVPFAAIGVGLWAYLSGRDALAGAALALGIVKPELAAASWAVMLGLALYERRWRVIAAFVITQVLLLAASVALAGWWIPGWLQAIQRYSAYARPIWLLATAFNISFGVGLALIGLMVVVLLCVKWSRWTAVALSIPLGWLLLPQTLLYGLTMLVIPLVMSWQGRARWAVVGAWLFGWAWLAQSIIYPQSWGIQSISMSAVALVVVTYASRQPSFSAPRVVLSGVSGDQTRVVRG